VYQCNWMSTILLGPGSVLEPMSQLKGSSTGRLNYDEVSTVSLRDWPSAPGPKKWLGLGEMIRNPYRPMEV